MPGTFYGMSNKGWTDKNYFSSGLKIIFYKYAVLNPPLLLLLDGHSSIQTTSIEFARENGIVLLSSSARFSAIGYCCFLDH